MKLFCSIDCCFPVIKAGDITEFSANSFDVPIVAATRCENASTLPIFWYCRYNRGKKGLDRTWYGGLLRWKARERVAQFAVMVGQQVGNRFSFADFVDQLTAEGTRWTGPGRRVYSHWEFESPVGQQ